MSKNVINVHDMWHGMKLKDFHNYQRGLYILS